MFHVTVTMYRIILGLVILGLAIFLFVGVISFRFVRLNFAGQRTTTSCEQSGVWQNMLPGFSAEGRYRDANGTDRPYLCEILEGGNGLPLYRCSMEAEDGRSYSVSGPTAAIARKKFLEALNVEQKVHRSGKAFFFLNRPDVRTAIDGASRLDPIAPSESTTASTHSSYVDNFMSGSGKANDRLTWGGIVSIGKSVKPKLDEIGFPAGAWRARVPGEEVLWRPGYHCRRIVRLVSEETRGLDLSVEESPSHSPIFICKVCKIEGEIFHPLEAFSSMDSTTLCRNVFRNLGLELPESYLKYYTGEDLFGLNLRTVRRILQDSDVSDLERNTQPPSSRSSRINLLPVGLWRQAFNLSRRATFIGLTPRFQRRRLKITHRLVSSLISNDVAAYVRFLVNTHSDQLADGLAAAHRDTVLNLFKNICLPEHTVRFELAKCAEMVVCGSLSQRSYNTVKSLLKKQNVRLHKYANVSSYLEGLDVGPILKKDHVGNLPQTATGDCMCVSVSTRDTLERIFRSSRLYSKMAFIDINKQEPLFTKLKTLNKDVFNSLDCSKRTLFVRQTGDNYRCFRLPTQQMSFNLMNLPYLNSPLAQFVQCLWRGEENRKFICVHCSKLYAELEEISQNGIDLTLPSGQAEHFNVIVIYVADLSHMEKVLGRASCTAKYGCWRCKKESGKWAKLQNEPAERISVRRLLRYGQKGDQELGANPRDDTKAYTEFHHSHFGQVSSFLFTSLCQPTMPPCSLHLILAMHRIFWKIIHTFTKARRQEHLLPAILRQLGCHYMAFQLESYVRSKGKTFDGSATLRFTGNDCKKLEEGVDYFCNFFCSSIGEIDEESTTKIRQFNELVRFWKPIAKELRDIETTSERVQAFSHHVQTFATKLISIFPSECSEKMIYFHLLRDHVGELMVFWFELMGWGYGVFSSTSGEHLNKRLKLYEGDHTNLGSDRFVSVLKNFRIKTLYFSDVLFNEVESKVTCSACGAVGHNKKNRLCPNKISRLTELDILDSDEET